MVKKTDYNTKVTEIQNKLDDRNHDKYIDTSEFNKLAGNVFSARLKHIFMPYCQALKVKSQKIKQKMGLLKMN